MRSGSNVERAQRLDNRTPRPEEEIRTHTIGELKPLSSRILIADYDPQWPAYGPKTRIRSLRRWILNCDETITGWWRKPSIPFSLL